MDIRVPSQLPAEPVIELVGELVPNKYDRPAALRPKAEAFAQRYTAHGNAARAYREAFDCSPTMKPATARQRGYELAHEPAVAARIRELYEQAAKDTTISARARMVRLQEITEADPGEVVRTVAESCRLCHGISHQHQWRDELEYAMAVAQAVNENAGLQANDPMRKPLPNDLGGYGFSPHNEPHPDCPQCHGYGLPRVVITPTDQLSPSARRLVKAVRQKPDGSIEVMMHDALAASDQLNKMQGVYVDRSVSINANLNVPALKDMTQEQALDFLDSLKPSA